jgi:hypothetical protein
LLKTKKKIYQNKVAITTWPKDIILCLIAIKTITATKKY